MSSDRVAAKTWFGLVGGCNDRVRPLETRNTRQALGDTGAAARLCSFVVRQFYGLTHRLRLPLRKVS
jgi:hypothetical protein